MSWLFDPVTINAIAWAFAAIFIGSAVSKLMVLDEFLGVVGNYRLLPRSLVIPVARSLPVVEIIAGLGLLLPFARFWAVLLVGALLVVFSAALAINLYRGRSYIDCGCFRLQSRRPISWALVARNLIMLGLTLLMLVAAMGHQALRPWTWFDFVTIFFSTITLTLLYAAVPLFSMPEYDEATLNGANAVSPGVPNA